MSEKKMELAASVNVDEDVEIKEEDKEPEIKDIKDIAFVQLICPKKDAHGEVVPFHKRLGSLLFPGFTWLSFTFWLGIVWVVWNVYLQIMMIMSPTFGGIAPMCTLIQYQCGSVVPFQKYDHQYWRPFVALFTADSWTTIAVGLLFLWMSGFQIEKEYNYWNFIPSMFLAGLGSACTGDAMAVRDVRAQGTTLLVAFIVMNFIAIHDKYKGDKQFMVRLILSVIECLKLTALIVPCLFTKTGDWMSAVVALGLGFGFGWGFIKTLDKYYSANLYFLWRRFQICVTTSCITYTVVMLAFSWFLFDDRREYDNLKVRYACAEII